MEESNMQLSIPKELLQYVRMSKNEGLIHHPSMPEELLPLFEETRKMILKRQQEQKDNLKNLLVKEEL